MERATFELEGIRGSYSGWHDPEDRWNGFANPLLSREESERLAAALNSHAGGGLTYAAAYDPGTDAFRISVIEDGEVLSVEAIGGRDVQGVGHVYDWGHGWCWWDREGFGQATTSNPS